MKKDCPAVGICLRLFVFVAILILSTACCALPVSAKTELTVVYDNMSYGKDLTAAVGLSCYIRANNRGILFDTGGKPDILFSNMDALGIDPKKIDIIVISHLHNDHTGGLMSLLEAHPGATVFLPDLDVALQRELRIHNTKFIVVDKPTQISKGVFLTGPVGAGIKEQALVMNSSSGLVVVCGCSHPGIVNIVNRTKELFSRPIYLVMGGFHTMPETAMGMTEIVQQFRLAGVQKVAPAHCTEEFSKAFFKASYGKNCISVGVGRTMSFPSTRR